MPQSFLRGPQPEALRAYERSRKRPAERVVRQSRAIGRIAQTANPLAARLRRRPRPPYTGGADGASDGPRVALSRS